MNRRFVQSSSRRQTESVVRFLAGAVIAIGTLGLLGWLLHLEAFKSIVPGLATMKFNTALCFVIAGVSLWLSRGGSVTGFARIVALGGAAAIVVIAVLSLIQDLGRWDLGIDELVVPDHGTGAYEAPGRMSVATALGFVLTGVAVLALHYRRIRLAQAFAFATMCLGLFALIGYLYDFEQLYALFAFSSMAAHTALSFVALSACVFLFTSSVDTEILLAGDKPGSIVARRIWLPLVIAIVVLGGLVEWSERHQMIGDSLDSAVLVVFTVVAVSVMVGWGARSLNTAHSRLLHVNRLYAVLSQCNQSIVHIDAREELFDAVCRSLVETGGFRIAWIGLVEQETGRVSPAAQVGIARGALVEPPITIQDESTRQSAIGRAIREDRPIVIAPDSRPRPAVSSPDDNPQAYASAAFPLDVHGHVIGALAAYSTETDYFKDREIELLKEVASDVSFAISKMESEARRLAAERDAAYLASIVASSDDAIISKDLNGIVTSWNRGAERLFGYAETDMVGTPITRLFPQDKVDEEEYILGQIRMGRRIEHFETVRLRKDGHTLDVSITVSPIWDASGEIVGVSKIARDITAQKQLEQAQKAAREAAEEANRMKSVILANMSHEIRTPLTSILGYAEVLKGQLDGQQRAFAKSIIQGGQRLKETLTSILTLADLEARQEMPSTDALVLAHEIEEMVSLFQEETARKGIQLSVEMGPEAANVHAMLNLGGFTIILQNLLGNAIKFTPQGGDILVSARVEPPLTTADPPFGWLSIQVSDTGIGIDPDFLPKLFHPFTQESSGTSRSYEGSGLGLSIALQIAERMGGSISVESEKGSGSRFTVRLPHVPYAPAAEAP